MKIVFFLCFSLPLTDQVSWPTRQQKNDEDDNNEDDHDNDEDEYCKTNTEL